MGKLDGKVAVVTGATSGIGQGIVEVFLEEGAKVVFCGRRAEKGQAFEEELKAKGFDATFIQADMTVDSEVGLLFDKAAEKYEKVDIWVNNAGIMRMAPIAYADVAGDWDAVMNINLRSYYIAIKYAASKLADGGAIVNLASIGGLRGAPNLASYGASKAAVISLTKTAAVELAERGIRVNAILPGTIFSEIMPRDAEFTQFALQGIPLGRGGEPREIGTVAAFLASSEASFVTGEGITVDGGYTAK